MGAEHEAVVRGFLAAMEGERWDLPRIERMLSHMAPEARYHVYAWEEPHVGLDAIRAEWVRHSAMFSDCREEIVTIGSVGSTVFTERLDVMTVNGRRVALHVAGVFEVDADGKIVAWRDYGDRKEVAALLAQESTS